MQHILNRRKFIKASALTGLGLSLAGSVFPLMGKESSTSGKRVGIIGLDTSHSIAFAKEINSAENSSLYGGYKVVAAYPKGSADIESSVKRIPGFTEEIKNMGIEIVESIPALLKKVDVILLETNDGRIHLEQALPVFKAGKTLFIDKPIAASLEDAILIFEASKHYKVPVFSASSLRYTANVQAVVNGKIGKVLGAETYSPATIEKTHPDFFWYGIHGVELLYTAMGTGCKELIRIHTEGTDVTVGTWNDGRIGTFRGNRTGKHLYGGTAFGENADAELGPYDGYKPLLVEIIKFFQTGNPPVSPEETLEICAFMEAADESKRLKSSSVLISDIQERARKNAEKRLKHLF